METLAAPPKFETRFDQNERDYNDLTTQFSEMLDGSMRTPFEFTYDGEELYAKDGQAIRRDFENGLEAADEIADANPNLVFEVRRRRYEIDEHYDTRKMTAGKLPNTMVVVSDFPPELMDATEDVGGYNVRRKQTMLRVLTWDGEKLKMFSQTLDRSDRKALEAIYQHFGLQADPGELLGQRIHVQLEAGEQHMLTDELTRVYDQALAAQYGGDWYTGRPNTSHLNTYDFVRAQQDLIQLSMQQKRAGTLNLWKIAATLQKRFERNARIQPEVIITGVASPFVDLHVEIFQASSQARAEGRVFSACGGTFTSGETASAEEQLQEAGYGNKTDETTEYRFNKKMHCVVCQAPPKEKDEPRKMCGPCGICRPCDAKFKK